MSNRGARWQRGTLSKSGENWVVRIREDDADNQGEVRRRERSILVASCADVRTRSQARTLADAIVDRVTGRGLTAGVSMGAAEYCRRYMAEHVVATKRASQSTINGRIRKHILPSVARLRLEQITARTAQTLVASMLADGLHSTTIRDTVRTLSRILKKAKADGMACTPFDVRSVSMPAKAEADVERQVFTAEEVSKVVAGSAYPWRLAYALQATVGLRCAEVLGLAWRDFEDGSVIIRRSVVVGRVQSLKSKTSARRLAVPPTVLEMLDEYRGQWQENDAGLLFATRNGKPFYASWYRTRLKADLKRLGFSKRGTHAFRHFTATHLLRTGQVPTAVRDHLRHSNISITNTYSHAVSSDLAKGAELLGEVVKSARVADVCGNAQQGNTVIPETR